LLIGVHPSAMGYDCAEHIECLKFLGYTVMEMSAFNFALDFKYVIDARVPEWRGWRNAMAEIEVWYPNRMVEWRKYKEQHPIIVVQVEGVDLEPEECYT
jgi:hypothetical protein